MYPTRAMELPPAALERALETWPVARLATRGPDGRPHLLPVVFARVGERLWSPVDAKPKADRELARVRHVRADPRVALLLDHYEDDWRRLWWVRVDGRADVVRRADPEADPEVAPVLAALRAKYPAYREGPVLRHPPTLLAIEIRRARSWCAGPEALEILGLPIGERGRG